MHQLFQSWWHLSLTDEEKGTHSVGGNNSTFSNERRTIACFERESNIWYLLILMRFIRWSLKGWTGLTYRGSRHTVLILSFLLESRYLGLPANIKGVDYLTGKGKSQKALIKQEVVKPQQVIAVSVKSSGCILEDGRGLVVAGTWSVPVKGPMYQSFNCAKRRFYSTNSIDNRLDLGVYLGKKVESNSKLWERALKNPQKVHYDLKGYMKDLNLWVMAHHKIVQKSEIGLDSEYTTSRVLVPTRAEMDKILSIQKRVLEGRYTFSPLSCFAGNKDYKSYFLYRKFTELAPTRRIRTSSYSCNLVETVLF